MVTFTSLPVAGVAASFVASFRSWSRYITGYHRAPVWPGRVDADDVWSRIPVVVVVIVIDRELCGGLWGAWRPDNEVQLEQRDVLTAPVVLIPALLVRRIDLLPRLPRASGGAALEREGAAFDDDRRPIFPRPSSGRVRPPRSREYSDHTESDKQQCRESTCQHRVALRHLLLLLFRTPYLSAVRGYFFIGLIRTLRGEGQFTVPLPFVNCTRNEPFPASS